MKTSDHHDDDLRKALARMHPAPLPMTLQDRLEASEPTLARAEEPTATSASWVRILMRLAVPGLAAAIIASVVFRASDTIESVETPLPIITAKQADGPATDLVFTPIETNQVVLAAEELALLPGPNDRPIQLMRVRVLDYERSRAKDGTEILVATPREQVIPITLTAY